MWEPVKISGSNVGSLADFEHQFVKGCTVVQAENKDDKGQLSNGGGKSTFFDVAGIALLGSSLLGRATKEIVNWDEGVKSMDIGMVLRNTITGEILEISRKIHKNTRGEELIILINGEVPREIPSKQGVKNGVSVPDGNDFLLRKIGISKDDLLSRYFIAPDYYKPFFKLGPKRLQEVIERFTHLGRLDKAISRMQEEHAQWDAAESQALALWEKADSNLSLIEDQIREAKENDGYQEWEKGINQNISLLVESSEKIREEISQIDIEPVLANIAEMKDNLNGAVNVLNSLKDSMVGADDEMNSVAEEKKEAIELRGEVVSIQSTAKIYLAHKLTCPNCSHEFVPDNDSFDSMEQAQITYDDTVETLKDIDNVMSDLTKRYNELLEESRSRSKVIRNQEDMISEIRSAIASKDQEVENMKSRMSRLKKDLEQNKIDLEILKGSVFSGNDIAPLEKRKNLLEGEMKAHAQAKSSAEEEKARRKQWEINFIDLKFQIINKRIKSISGLINYYLQKMGSDLTVDIEGFKKLKSGEMRQVFTPWIYRGGDNPQKYVQFSGGERARLDMAADMAFQEMINATVETGGLNYYQNDEVLNPVDSLGIANAAEAFDNFNKPILLVTHSGSELSYKKVVYLVKENGKSHAVQN